MALASLLFVLLSALASWRVWRRSPSYSLKVTLQIFGVAAAILVLFLSLAYLPVPDNMHAALLIGSLLVCLLGAPALIIRITDGHVAALPVSVRVLSTHRHKIQGWIWRLLTFVAVCAGLALVLKGDLIWLPITLGGFVVLCASAALVALYMRAIRLDRGLSIVLAEPWIHWQYTQDAWNAWASSQLSHDQSQNAGFLWKRDWRKYLKIFCWLLPLFFVCSWLVLNVGIKERVFIALALSVFMVLVIAALAVSARADSFRRYRKMIASVPDTCIGEEGIYSGGTFTLWSLSGSYLVEAVTESEPPPHIRFVFQTNITETKQVLIPAGREADLDALQEKLHNKIPKARIRVLMPSSSV
jgi:hypothetical protein